MKIIFLKKKYKKKQIRKNFQIKYNMDRDSNEYMSEKVTFLLFSLVFLALNITGEDRLPTRK